MAVRTVIRGYTREAGVRNLERESVPQSEVARRRAEGDTAKVVVTREVVTELLGAPRFLDEEPRGADEGSRSGGRPGEVLAGGEVLFVEASRMQGGGSLTLTGHLGDVMKESARTAPVVVPRARAALRSVDPAFYKDAEIHLHVPSGAIPKDGPSAGVTMVTALASELTGRPVRGDIAMTGEITRRAASCRWAA